MKILITGASEGIGLETAKILAAEKNQLTLVARNEDKLQKAISSLYGTGHSYFVADLSKHEDVESFKEKIDQGKYEVFINNAGVGMYGRFTELSLPEQERMMNLNMNALTALSYYYLSQAKKGDALINLASTLGTSSFPGLATYSATRAYIINFSEALWYEYKSKDIFVSAFCPGVTKTSFHDSASGSYEGYPGFIMQTPVAVAKELIHALKSRSKPKNVSGGMNRFMLFFQKMLSRKMVVNMMGSFSPVKN